MIRHANKIVRFVTLMIGLGMGITLFGASPGFGQGIDFEFNTDGVLPSAQGATYVTSGVSESTAFSVSGGILHQNTTVFGSDVEACYIASGVYNPTHSATLDISAKVISNSFEAAEFYLDAGNPSTHHGLLIDLQPNDVQVYDVSGNLISAVSMDTTDAFHDYEVVVPAGMPSYQLFVDGVLRYSGSPFIGTAFNNYPQTLGWGDLSAGNGDAAVDWNYVRLTNNVAAGTPEPGTLALLGAGLLTGGAYFLRRLSHRKAAGVS